MKLAVFTTLSLLVMTSTSFAFLSESVTCDSLDGKTQIAISTNNRPDVEIGVGFDSDNIPQLAVENDEEDAVINYGVESSITVDGQSVTGRIEVLSVAAGTTTDVTDVMDNDIFTGEPVSPSRLCTFGSKTVGFPVQARITVGGNASVKSFICSSELSRPRGAIECVDVAPNQTPAAP